MAVVGTYRPAAICRRGHMITDDMTRNREVGERCVKCGARVLTACPTCGHRIRGDYDVPGVVVIGFETPRPIL